MEKTKKTAQVRVDVQRELQKQLGVSPFGFSRLGVLTNRFVLQCLVLSGFWGTSKSEIWKYTLPEIPFGSVSA